MWLFDLVAKQIHIFFICGIESLPLNIGDMNIIKEVGEINSSLIEEPLPTFCCQCALSSKLELESKSHNEIF
jgi:hypothetical protein